MKACIIGLFAKKGADISKEAKSYITRLKSLKRYNDYDEIHFIVVGSNLESKFKDEKVKFHYYNNDKKFKSAYIQAMDVITNLDTKLGTTGFETEYFNKAAMLSFEDYIKLLYNAAVKN